MKNVAQTVIEAESFYTIAAQNGCVIEAVENAEDGGDLRLGKYVHKPAQEWAFDRVGDGIYRIRSRANGKLIDLMMTGTANGTWLHLWEDVGGTSQMWTLQPTPEGTVRLVSSWAGGKCIDTVGMGADEGAILQIWQETVGSDQLWTISKVKDRVKRTAKKAAASPAEKTEAPAEAEAAAEPAPAAEEKPKRTRKPRAKKATPAASAAKAPAEEAVTAEKPKRTRKPRAKKTEE